MREELSAAIMTKFTAAPGGVNNDLYNYIGGRMYDEDEAPQDADLPYVTFMSVSSVPEYPGGKTIEDDLLQFSLFSASVNEVSKEIKYMLKYLRALYDDCILAITGETPIFFIRRNAGSLGTDKEATTKTGTTGIKGYFQEYETQTVK